MFFAQIKVHFGLPSLDLFGIQIVLKTSGQLYGNYREGDSLSV
jgi:hypothetical protein